MRELNNTIDTIRKKSRPTTRESFDSLKQEERMTKEFFQKFQSRTSNNAIPELFVTDDWNAPGHDTRNTTADDAEIRRELRKYYVWLYQERRNTRDHELEEALETRPMSEHDSGAIEGKITLEELTDAITQIGSGKSAGPDALPAEFYKSFTDLVKHDFLRVINLALEQGQLNVSMREGDIILLYKKGDTRDPRNYRPITLLQSDYKILAKVLILALDWEKAFDTARAHEGSGP